MKRLLFAWALAALPTAAPAADLVPADYSWIDEVAPVSHRATVTFSLAATYFDMDAANGFAAGIFNNTNGDFISPAGDGRFETWGFSGDMETWLPANASHYFIGGLEGAWAKDDQSSVLTIDDGFSVLPISGGNPTTFPKALAGPAISPLEISSSGEFHRVAGVVGIGTDVAEGTKLGAGAYVGYSQLDADALYYAPSFNLSPLNSIDETVNTWSAGVVVLGEGRHEVMPGLGVFFKGRAAVLYANGDLNAMQEALGELEPLLADDRQDAFAGLVDGQLGFDVAFGPNATIAIFGGAAWRNDVFEIVNPATGIDGTNGRPYVAAHLEQTDLIEYSVGGALAFNF